MRPHPPRRHQSFHRCPFLWLVVGVNSLAGCAPAVRLPTPVDWPQTWCERRLYHTPLAYIYAANDAAAGEADRLLRRVAEDFRHEAGDEPTKGLVIVTDLGDPLPPGRWLEIDRLFEQQANKKSASTTAPASRPDNDGTASQPDGNSTAATAPASQSEDSPPAATAPASQPQEEKQSAKEKLAELGLSGELLCRIASLGLPLSQARQLFDLPPEIGDTPKWVVHLSTRSQLADCNRQMMQAMFKSNKVSLAARLMVAPMLAMLEPKMVDTLATARQVAVFGAFAHGHVGWNEQQKRQIGEAYGRARMKQVADDLQASAEEAAAKAKERLPHPQSQPATAPATAPANDPASDSATQSAPAADPA